MLHKGMSAASAKKDFIAKEAYLYQSLSALLTYDVLLPSGMLIGITYSLCSSTYLMPFAINNLLHIGVNCLLKHGMQKKYITEDQALLVNIAFADVSICLGFEGLGSNNHSFLTNNNNYSLFTAMPYSSALINKDILVGTTVLGIITPLCLGIVNKVGELLVSNQPVLTPDSSDGVAASITKGIVDAHNRENNGNTSILKSTIIGTLSQYPKYLICKSLFPNNSLAIACGGAVAYVIQHYFNPLQPNSPSLLAVSALVGAYNNTAYSMLGKIPLMPLIAASIGIDVMDNAFKSFGKTFVEKVFNDYSNKTHLKVD
jgi:hypothetical protein